MTYNEFRELCSSMYRDHRSGPKVLRLTRMQATVLALTVVTINEGRGSVASGPIAPPVTSIVNPVTGEAVPIELVA